MLFDRPICISAAARQSYGDLRLVTGYVWPAVAINIVN
jgi:hypothetical protein